MQALEVISINLWLVLISLANLAILYTLVKKFLYKPKLYTSDYFFNKGLIKKGDETSIWTLQPNN